MAEITVGLAWDAIDYDHNEQDAKSSTATLYYIVDGAVNESEAIAAVTAEAPESFENIPRQGISISERLTETNWKVEAKYAHKTSDSGGEEADDEDPQFNFDISSGSRKIVTSIKQLAKYPASAPNSQGINDGEGVDIVMPVCSISETHYFKPAKITTAWKRKVAMMVGCINQSAFMGFNAGELLFSGCSGTRTGNSSKDKWQITFRFSVQPNQSGFKVGNFCTINKRGWDILWIRYKEEIQTTGDKKVVLKVPAAAYIEQVYLEANFDSLGI